MFFKIGDTIEFKNDYWDSNGKHFKKIVKAKILGFIIDPLKRHKSKYLVKHKINLLGIPEDEVLNIQIELKL